MKIPVEVQRRIARYINEHDLSNRGIAKLLTISHNTVQVIRRQLMATSVSWRDLESLDDDAFAKLLGTRQVQTATRKLSPDWFYIHLEHQRPDVTLELLWQEFREQEPDGISYPHMARQYGKWLKTQKISMRQIYRAGEKMFVDFCGRTVPIMDRDTGEKTLAQIFVAVLGSSRRFFVWAVPSQKVQHWLECHIKAFDYFGGVPQQVVPDNLKSAVIKHTRHDIVLNRGFADLSDHYKFVIVPGRPRKPKDKALAEVTVQIVQRGILAPLRDHKFFSIDDLNAEIQSRVQEINKKTTKKFPISRLDLFHKLDGPVLKPLPTNNYEIADWQYNVRVPENYVLEWQGCLYSVPCRFTHFLVDIRVSADLLEVFHRRQRIAVHTLKKKPGETSIVREHMPTNHQHQWDSDPESLLAWAEAIGPNTTEFTRLNLTQRTNFANGLKTMQRLRRWSREEQLVDRLESACAYAIRIKALTFDRLESIIRHNRDSNRDDSPTTSAITHGNLRGPDYFKNRENENVK